MYGAIIRARRPGLGEASAAGVAPRITPIPVVGKGMLPVVEGDGSCCGETGCC